MTKLSNDAVQAPADAIQGLLERAREQLGMDICFVGEHAEGKRIFRFVEGDKESFGVDVGVVDPADETYCQRMLDGILPSIVPDARADERTASLPITFERNIGSFVGVPIVLPTGRVYGTLCALGHQDRHDLDERALATVRFIASMISENIARESAGRTQHEAARTRVEAVLNGELGLRSVYQPIVQLATGRIAGYEALARFADGSSPAERFNEAWAVGLGMELELKAGAVAVEALDLLPSDSYLSINVSPRTITSRDFGSEDFPIDVKRIVVEITEHATIEDYEVMGRALSGVLDRGVRLAIDDAGAGYSSLSHIMRLSPAIIKLDIVFTRGIDSDPMRRSLTAALAMFAADIDATIVAEGIETAAEMQTLHALGVEYGQGYYLGKPVAVEALRA